MDREGHFTVQRMSPERGGDGQLTQEDYQRYLESGKPVSEWPRDSKTTVAEHLLAVEAGSGGLGGGGGGKSRL